VIYKKLLYDKSINNDVTSYLYNVIYLYVIYFVVEGAGDEETGGGSASFPRSGRGDRGSSGGITASLITASLL